MAADQSPMPRLKDCYHQQAPSHRESVATDKSSNHNNKGHTT
jgi:hypothetical protein